VELYSAELDGSVDFFRTIHTAGPLWIDQKYNADQPFTIEVVFKPDLTASTQVLVSNRTGAGVGFDFTYEGVTNQLQLRLETVATTNELFVRTSTTYASNIWYRSIVHYPGTMSAGDVIVVVNGVEATMQAPFDDTLSSNFVGGRFGFGAHSSTGSNLFDGRIHRIRGWSGSVVTAAQMIAAATVVPGPLPSELDFHYRCGNGWDVRDVNMTMNNYAWPGRIAEQTDTTNRVDLHLEDQGNPVFVIDAPS
jgi:hypothetical protein